MGYPELAGFVFWSDDGHYNVVANKNGPELMARPEIVKISKKVLTKSSGGGGNWCSYCLANGFGAARTQVAY